MKFFYDFLGELLRGNFHIIFASVIITLTLCAVLVEIASTSNNVFFISLFNREGFLMMIVQILQMSWTLLQRKARVSIELKQMKNRKDYQLRTQIMQCCQMMPGIYFPLLVLPDSLIYATAFFLLFIMSIMSGVSFMTSEKQDSSSCNKHPELHYFQEFGSFSPN